MTTKETIKRLCLMTLVGAWVLVGLSACLGDDDENEPVTNQFREITDTDRQQMMDAVCKDWSGKALFMNYETFRTDSVDASWIVSRADTIMTVQFPMSILAKLCNDGTFKEALADAGSQEVRAKIYLPVTGYIPYLEQHYYQLEMVPVEGKTSFEHNGHAVTVNFSTEGWATQEGYAYPTCFTYANGFEGTFIVKTVNLDGLDYTINHIVVFYKK